MASGGRRSKGSGMLRRLFICIAVLVMLWGTLAPIYMMHAYQPTYDHLDLQSNGPGGPAPIRRADTPSFHGGPVAKAAKGDGINSLWTLENLKAEGQQVPRDWVERTRLIYERNVRYLARADGRATQTTSNITLVSGMMDLGRGNINADFKRSFNEYIQRFSVFLKYKFPIIIYVQKEHLEDYQPYLDAREDLTHVSFKTLDDVRDFEFFDKVQKIRTNPEWFSQADWLSKSPQAKLELYNPLVMSKMGWVRDAARLNPFNTDAFLWIDGGHACNDPYGITPDTAQLFRDHFDKLLITFFDYEPVDEIHGFRKHEFWEFIGTNSFNVRVGRGGIFGGTREYLDVTTEIYNEILDASLSAGLMGTEENIFAILYYRFPELVHDFDNGESGNCGIFYNIQNNLGPSPWKSSDLDHDIIDGYNLRGLECDDKANPPYCYAVQGSQRTRCPSHVTPRYLTLADGQWSCTQEGDYYCTVECYGEDREIAWMAHGCDDRPLRYCPPWQMVPFDKLSGFNDPLTDLEKDATSMVRIAADLPEYDVTWESLAASNRPAPVVIAQPTTPLSIEAPVGHVPPLTDKERKFSDRIRDHWAPESKEKLKKYGIDLRGLGCQIKDGKEVCYLDNPTGPRDLCPPHVTSEYLAMASDQWSCRPETEDQFCTAICQDGSGIISWTAYDARWCAENEEHCRPRPAVIPYDEWGIKKWDEPAVEPKPCDYRSAREFTGMDKVTFLVLVRGNEVPTLQLSMNSWEEAGLIQFADEFIIFVNNRGDEMNAFLEPYTQAPYNIKVLGDEQNLGILRALNALILGASNDNVLFLEKDFRLVESLPCALEQISSGLDMLNGGVADIVKYRSRYNAGRPNWADILFRGKEDSVFASQPNLLCNFYHWVDEPHKRWPDQFSICHDNPTFYCTTSEFCNWTNNPFLLRKSWWKREYFDKFPEISDPPEGLDLETWMNWNGQWNNRGWVIASGDGMFKHADLNNLGVW